MLGKIEMDPNECISAMFGAEKNSVFAFFTDPGLFPDAAGIPFLNALIIVRTYPVIWLQPATEKTHTGIADNAIRKMWPQAR